MKNNLIYILLLLYAVTAAFTIIHFNGTGDSGDSVYHYLFAKYAPIHPQLFFDHWAKPVYVLLACPFAQFGIYGIKVFNACTSLLTIYFTFRSAKELKLKNPVIAVILLMFSPLYYILTFSGLTEPLFALFISIGLYTMLKQKYTTSSIILSFLPFVRSEGLIIIAVFGIYLLLKAKWKLLPVLLTGHIVYSIAGYFVYDDFLWVFNKIPYAHLSSTYGNGKLFHFTEQLIYVTGVPIYILFWIGTAIIIWKSFKRKITAELQILVFLGFFSFLVAHSLFWYLGIFNSMGLKRVLLCVIPLISIISLIGINFITEVVFKNKKVTGLIIQGILILYILIFPFTGNPAAINWDRDMKLSADQRSAILVAGFVVQNYGTDHRYIYTPPYLSEILKIDYFNAGKRIDLTRDFMKHIKPGDILIWENWLSVVENGVTKEFLDSTPGLINIYNTKAKADGREVLYSVYRLK
jgi:hypothetical protein